MRPITMMQAQFKADTQTGENLQFEVCKGGYFSDRDDFGLRLVGSAAQDSLTGKNLFNINNYELIDLNQSHSPRNVDGVLYGGGRMAYWAGRSIRIHAEVGDVITISADVVGTNVAWAIRSGDSPDGAYIYERQYTLPTPPGSRLVITHEVTKSYTGLTWYAEDGSEWSAGLKNLQFEIGSTSTSFEPYCGGIPSPNPDYPMPIQCVKAGTKVQVLGRNLVNVEEFTVNRYSAYVNDLRTQLNNLPKGDYLYKIGYDCETDGSGGLAGRSYCHIMYSDGSTADISDRGANKILPPGKVISGVMVYGASSAGVTNTFKNFVVTFADHDCVYVPYISGGEITIPCDLYYGDTWWPMLGKVERKTREYAFTGNEHFRFSGTFYYEGSSTNAFVDMYSNGQVDSNQSNTSTSFCNALPWQKGVYGIKNIMGFCTNASQLHMRFSNEILGVSDDATKEDKLEAYKAYLKLKYEEGNPIKIYYPLLTPIVEQYIPQPIHAPSGTVNILQAPSELAGILSATMLVRR